MSPRRRPMDTGTQSITRPSLGGWQPGQSIPACAGIGLRHPHVGPLIESNPPVAWLEIHSENYLCDGGPRKTALERLRERYPISCHGVGLSLGSAEGLDRSHLTRLRNLFDWINPGLVSEHVAWSVTDGTYLNDLLPLPYTKEALEVICQNVDTAQQHFGRQILVENPSSYVTFVSSTMAEWDFMAEIVRRTGCGLLLDVNNIHVSGHNHKFDVLRYLDNVPLETVREVHVAGHMVQRFGDTSLLIDDHGDVVSDAVWRLFEEAVARLGPVPTLVEWDTRIPDLDVLLSEARKAQRVLDRLTEADRTGQWHAA